MARLHAAVRAQLGAPLATGTLDATTPDVGPTPEEADLLEHTAPRRYLDLAQPAQQAAHARLLITPLPAGAVRAAARRGSVDSTTVVSIAALDRPGLFADCAGVLSAHDLDVVEARAFTGPGKVALDWFTIDGGFDADAVIADLAAVGDGQRSVEQLLTRRRRPRATALLGAVDVTIHNAFTVEVQAPDRPGLLYRLCRALHLAGLNVTAARISSIGPAVFDVFEVVPSIPADQVEAVKRALVSAATPPN